MVANQGSVKALAIDFNVDETTVRRIYDSTLCALSFFFKYQQPYPNYDELLRGTSAELRASCRGFEGRGPIAIIIGDCTERFTQYPKRTELFNFLWSRYKHHCTVKLLTGVLSCGFTCHLSCWGPAADDATMRAAGLPFILGNAEGRNGRQMCWQYDRGIEELVQWLQEHIFVDTPPKAEPNQKFFSKESTEHSQRQAPGRITVEHVNRLMWEYEGASRHVNLSRIDMVGHEMLVTAGLCNLQPAHSGKAQASSHETIVLSTPDPLPVTPSAEPPVPTAPESPFDRSRM